MGEKTSYPVVWKAEDIPEHERKWLLDRANHRQGAEALAKPLRDGQMISVTMLYQTQMRAGKTVQVRAGVTGVRTGHAFEDQVVQLPLDAWAVSDADFQTARMQQFAQTRTLTKGPILSLTDAKRRIDFKVHDHMAFNLIEEIANDDLTHFLDYSRGGDFMPWIRSPAAAMRFARPVFFRDQLRRLVDSLMKIHLHGGVRLRRSFEFELQSDNDNCPPEEDQT
jgi:hypothetical protein